MQLEEKILNRLSKKIKVDFLTFRSKFPLTTEFKDSYDNLIDLDLIETNGDYIQLSLKGIKANQKGLDIWTKEKVYSDIKNMNFWITKDLQRLELLTLRNLENEEYVYDSGNGKYKIIPKNDYLKDNISKKKKNKLPKFPNINFKSILLFIVGAITLALAFFSPLENKYHYINSIWEWILN